MAYLLYLSSPLSSPLGMLLRHSLSASLQAFIGTRTWTWRVTTAATILRFADVSRTCCFVVSGGTRMKAATLERQTLVAPATLWSLRRTKPYGVLLLPKFRIFSPHSLQYKRKPLLLHTRTLSCGLSGACTSSLPRPGSHLASTLSLFRFKRHL